MPRLLALACLTAALLACTPAARADDGCPQLPDGSGLRWEQRDVPGMVFCKALADDGGERFSVVLGKALPFRPDNALAAGRGAIDGRKIRWYRGGDAFRPDLVIRETLLRLGGGREAHIVVRAPSEALLSEWTPLVEGLRFGAGG
ncbi:MAG: hypothetical protein LCH70_00590 [Proteobacteria bacterium]|nr:hypothetical protein [Pseudomonadota bacterium]